MHEELHVPFCQAKATTGLSCFRRLSIMFSWHPGATGQAWVPLTLVALARDDVGDAEEGHCFVCGEVMSKV